jgi:hypothetical protein
MLSLRVIKNPVFIFHLFQIHRLVLLKAILTGWSVKLRKHLAKIWFFLQFISILSVALLMIYSLSISNDTNLRWFLQKMGANLRDLILLTNSCHILLVHL